MGRVLRVAGLLEGTTLVALLCLAVPMKRLLGWPHGVSVIGPVHGLTFIFYVWCLAEAAAAEGWRWRQVTRAGLACLIPFGTFWNDRWLRRQVSA